MCKRFFRMANKEKNHKSRLERIGIGQFDITHLEVVSPRIVEQLRKSRQKQKEDNDFLVKNEQKRRAIDFYSNNGYKHMNYAIRKFLVPAAKNYNADEKALITNSKFGELQRDYDPYTVRQNVEFSKELNSAILEFPRLSVPITVYRGVQDLYFSSSYQNVDSSYLQYRKRNKYAYYEDLLQVGEIIPFFGFISTSLSPNIAVAMKIYGANGLKNEKLEEFTDSTSCCFLQFKLPAGYPIQYIDSSEYEIILPYVLDNGYVPQFEVVSKKQIIYKYDPDDSRLECLNAECLKQALERSKISQKYLKLNLIQLRPVF